MLCQACIHVYIRSNHRILAISVINKETGNTGKKNRGCDKPKKVSGLESGNPTSS